MKILLSLTFMFLFIIIGLQYWEICSANDRVAYFASDSDYWHTRWYKDYGRDIPSDLH
jgi:hypothetical protein